jgi:hypothetical protein
MSMNHSDTDMVGNARSLLGEAIRLNLQLGGKLVEFEDHYFSGIF